MDTIRSRDCIILHKGDTQTVVVSQAMVNAGWPGGQGVNWSGSTADERVVTFSNGLFGGILVWGSDESGDSFASITRSQVYYKYATLFTGGMVLSTSTYERYTFTSRIGPGPLVPLVYQAGEPLYLSRRGFFTNEDEMSLDADILAPALSSGCVAQVPKTRNNHFLGVQTFL